MKPGPVPHPLATVLTPCNVPAKRHYLHPAADLEKDGPKLMLCGGKGQRGPRNSEVYELPVCKKCAVRAER